MKRGGGGTRATRVLAVFAFVAVVCGATLAAAKPGSLDRTFSGDGRTTTDFGDPTGADADAVAIGSRGRITAVGDIGGCTRVALARLMPNGAPDTSFSRDGRIATTLDGDCGSAADVELTRTAATLIGGSGREQSNLPYGFMLAQFRRGGALDRSFGSGGVRYTYLRGLSEINDITIDGKRRIVAVGYSSADASYGDSAFAVVRFSTRGHLDRSFSGDGKLILRVGGAFSQARAVEVDDAGRILVGGVAAFRRKSVFAVVRLSSRGRLDKSFAGDGAILTPGTGGCEARCPNGVLDLALDRRERIVAAGDAVVARYSAKGRLDRSFNRDGIFRARDFGSAALALDHRGRVVLAGNTGGRSPIDFAVMRLTRHGVPDESFGDYVGIKDENRFVFASDVAIDRRGRIVAVGRSDGAGRFAYVRYLSD